MDKSMYDAIVIGVSAGALNALTKVLPRFPARLPVAVIVICHRMQTPDNYLTEYLAHICKMTVQDVENLEFIQPGIIYIAPPGYHVLIADDFCFNLSPDARVNYSRPSIDVTFETAADVYGKRLIGIILTGANTDGAAGLNKIKRNHGYTIVQDPKSAQSYPMPTAAIAATSVDFIGSLDAIAHHVCQLFSVEVVPLC